MESPNYLNTQAITEGLDQTAAAMLTAGTALLFAGRGLPGKAAGTLILIGYFAVRRARHSHRIRQELVLPVDLPLNTRTALHLLTERHHNGATNFSLQVAVDDLVETTATTDAPRDLLFTSPQPKEPASWARIREAHRNLDAALARHFNQQQHASVRT